MAFYRVKQFYWSLNSKINDDDEQFLKYYMNSEELDLFNKLPDYEKKHSIRVARDVKEAYDGDSKTLERLVKAALFHDIGKTVRKFTPIDKSVMVILDCISKGKVKRFKKIKNIDIYYNHADIGYNMLKKYDYEERFLYLIKNHHNNNIIGDKELDILKKCDSKN